MKVIFLKDIDKVGRVGDVKDVANGYFRNYLLPHKLAKQATPSSIREAEQNRAKQAQQYTHDREAFKTSLEQIKNQEFIVFRKATEEGHLFGSVTEHDITDLLAQKGFIVEEKHIIVEQSIKELGTYPITLQYDENISGTISLAVERGK
jgi:large subunit ribosomal protein L9